MTARDTYTATLKTVSPTAAASLVANAAAHQETINAAGVNTQSNAATLVNGNATFVAAVVKGNKARFAADFAAEQAKQATLAVARDTLRTTGDVGPV